MRITILSKINIIRIDIGESTFHLFGYDSSGRKVYRKKLSRPKLIQLLANTEGITVAMKPCGSSHWSARKCQ
ncbi:MAG: transposase [Oceanospirillaceae bacterium]|jgi:transposase